MTLRVPVVGCAAEWVATCQYAGGDAYDRGCYGLAGVLVYRRCETVRLFMRPKGGAGGGGGGYYDVRLECRTAPTVALVTGRSLAYEDAECVHGELYAGPGPALRIWAYGETMRADVEDEDEDRGGRRKGGGGARPEPPPALCRNVDFYGRFLAKCYRVNDAVRRMQRRWRQARAFARAVGDRLPGDLVSEIVSAIRAAR